MADKARIAVIGGGIMGVTLAYKLSAQGYKVTVYERGENLGGLVGYIPYDGVRMDRFYHTILSSDMTVQGLIEEAGVKDKLHFTVTGQGFYDKGRIYSFNGIKDFLLFPPLTPFQRFRLGLQIIAAQFESDWRKMEPIPVEKWLTRVSGRAVYEKVWKPLLRSKFDSASTDVPATYIWSRLKRMMGARKGATSVEMMCYLENGYYTLVEGLAARAEKQGATFHVNTVVDEVTIENGSATGVRVKGEHIPYDAVIATLQSPILEKLVPNAPADFRGSLARQEYLGVLCPMLLLKKSMIPYYVLNITDDRIPFTAVVETTRLIDPKHVAGHHIVYLPKYLAPGNPMAQWTDEQVKTEWLKYIRQMFPDFDQSNITEFFVQRARYVEPLRPLGTTEPIMDIQSPVQNLYMGSTAMIYPDLGNGEAMTRFALKVVDQVIADTQSGKLRAQTVTA